MSEASISGGTNLCCRPVANASSNSTGTSGILSNSQDDTSRSISAETALQYTLTLSSKRTVLSDEEGKKPFSATGSLAQLHTPRNSTSFLRKHFALFITCVFAVYVSFRYEDATGCRYFRLSGLDVAPKVLNYLSKLLRNSSFQLLAYPRGS